MLSLGLGVIATILLFANAQETYTIDPDSVPIATRDQWCSRQESTCPILCLQLPAGSSSTVVNICDTTSLTYSCVCGNGQSPNATQYSATLPFFICQEWGVQCVAGCGNNNTCQSACTQDHPCGAQNPTRVNVTSTTSSTIATATGTNSVSSGSASGPTADSANDAQSAIKNNQSLGLALVVTGLLAAFTSIT